MGWEAIRGSRDSDNVPPRTTTMSTDWRVLINCTRLFLGEDLLDLETSWIWGPTRQRTLRRLGGRRSMVLEREKEEALWSGVISRWPRHRSGQAGSSSVFVSHFFLLHVFPHFIHFQPVFHILPYLGGDAVYNQWHLKIAASVLLHILLDCFPIFNEVSWWEKENPVSVKVMQPIVGRARSNSHGFWASFISWVSSVYMIGIKISVASWYRIIVMRMHISLLQLK